MIPFILVVVIAVAGALAAVYFSTGDILETENMTLSAHWSRMIPVLGWYKGMIMCAVNGEVVPFLIYLVLMLASVVVFIVAIWQIPADFYEDALSEASKRAQMLDAAKEGRVVNTKKRSGRIQREGVFEVPGLRSFYQGSIQQTQDGEIWSGDQYDAVLFCSYCLCGCIYDKSGRES